MNRRVPQLAIWLMWLALPFTVLSYRQVWDRLPVRMAVHFDANWQPNGWTTRQASLGLALGITVFLLLVFTVGSYVLRAAKPPLTGWVLLAFFYVVIGLVSAVNHRVIEFNLNAQASHAALSGVEVGGWEPGRLLKEGMLSVVQAAESRALSAACGGLEN
ncbi:MAG: DUF1648 domain-containing protein [Candidatus Sulfotelmatobacter sp.]